MCTCLRHRSKMGGKKHALKKLGRLEEKKKQREAELKALRNKKKQAQCELMDACEARAIRSRVEFYDEIRAPFKAWPRIQFDFNPIKATTVDEPCLFQEALEINNDLICPIILNLSPKEYQSLSLVSHHFHQLLHTTKVLYVMVGSVVDYLVSKGTDIESQHMKWLTEKKNFLTSQTLLDLSISKIKILPYSFDDHHQSFTDGRLTLMDHNSKFIFFNSYNGQFGDVTEDLLFSMNSLSKKKKALSFKKKYGFPCKKKRNLTNARDLRKLDFQQIQMIPPNQSVFGDLYLRDYNSAYDYYRPLTKWNEDTIMFKYNSESKIDIYYDWFVIRKMMKEHYGSCVTL